MSFRFFDGKIPSAPNLPDIDLAIINEREKICLLSELKWFIAPGEAREIIEKSEEVQKGIQQLETISKTLKTNPNVILDALRINAEYEIFFAVISESSIGLRNVQSSDIPVIRLQHFLKAMEQTTNFRSIVQWLYDRGFLPIIGIHYEIRDFNYTIGQYKLPWYQVRALLEDDYLMTSLP